jgi:hypothetical protein
VSEPEKLDPIRRAKPHATSVAVWGAASPVVAGSAFTVRVGVACSSCDLAETVVRVHDERGSLVSEGRVGREPWPGTRGLYVTELSLVAPASERVFRWSASFSGDGLSVPHESSSCLFSFRTAHPAEHAVKVEVTDRDFGAPLEGVSVFLDIYHAVTDARGLAELRVPRGDHALVARKHDRETATANVVVEGNRTLAIQMGILVRRDPDEEEVWM